MFDQLVESVDKKRRAKRWVYFAGTSIAWTIMLAGTIAGGIYFYQGKVEASVGDQLRVTTMLKFNLPGYPFVCRVKNNTPKLCDCMKPTTDFREVEAVKEFGKLEEKTIVEKPNSPEEPLPPGCVIVGEIGDEVDLVSASDQASLQCIDFATAQRLAASQMYNSSQLSPPISPEQVESPEQGIIRLRESEIRGNALVQVEPKIPPMVCFTGEIKVEITINENGEVIKAKAISGHPIVHQISIDAARQWRFNPTILNGTPVKVQSVLTFRFTM